MASLPTSVNTYKCPERQVHESVHEYLSSKNFVSAIELGTLHTLMTKHHIDGIGMEENDIDIDLDHIDPIFPWRARGFAKFHDFVASVPGLTSSRTKDNHHCVCIDHNAPNIEYFFTELEKVPIKIKSMQQRKQNRMLNKKRRHKKQTLSLQAGYSILSKLSCLTLPNEQVNINDNNLQIMRLRNSLYSKISSSLSNSDESKVESTVKDYNVDGLDNIDWTHMPDGLCPEKVILNARNKEKRATWKKRQIETFYEMLKYLLIDMENSQTIVDFGCGSGNIGLALAFLFPMHQFILVDYNPYCIKLANERMNKNELSNVKILQCKIEEFQLAFDVGIACHACGSATDHAQIQCFENKAHFILCSCCVGKIEKGPRSQLFAKDIGVEEFQQLSRIADHNETDLNADRVDGEKRKLCKSVLELDRIYAAKESKQYDVVLLTQIIPYNDAHSTSPKNDVIIGVHKSCHDNIKGKIKRMFIGSTKQ